MMVFDLSKKDFIYFLDILPNDFTIDMTKIGIVKCIRRKLNLHELSKNIKVLWESLKL